MTKEIINFNLPSGNHCELCMTELNYNVVALEPLITLISPEIPPYDIQDIINEVISLNRNYIKSLYFERIKYTYKIISFSLFGHIRAALKKELKTPTLYDSLKSNKDNYSWIESSFLPKFVDNIDTDIEQMTEGTRLLHLCHENTTYYNTPYTLHSPEFIFNYVYDIHPTDLVPIFDVYIKSKIDFPTDPPESVVNEIKSFLVERFNNFDYNLILM